MPPERKPRTQAAPKLDLVRTHIDAMLRQDLDAPRKQHQTATRIWNRLIDEHAADASYAVVRDYVRRRRPEIETDAGRRLIAAFVPQQHAPGMEAEVDFGEVWVVLAGAKTKCHMFTFRLSASGKAVHRVYPTQAQEAFLEGHIAAFETIRGVPALHIKYDNLTPAVVRVIHGTRDRVENDRWVLFRSHYGFDAFYCEPGIDGAHEKGGVEGEVGRFRRTWLSPMPVVDSLDQLNAMIAEWDVRDDARRITGRRSSVGEAFALEQPLLQSLPAERFDPGLVLHARVDRSALVTVRQAKYSVPARLVGRQVRVSLRASEMVVFDGRQQVAWHQRVVERFGESIDLDHYLEVLQHKPGALPGSTALASARTSGMFTAAHEAFWQESRKVNGDSRGTRELIDVLLLHRSMRAVDVTAGIRAALTVGAVTADVVAVEARLHASGTVLPSGATLDRHPAHPDGDAGKRVVSLTQRRLTDPAAVIAGLPADARPLPSVAAYDELLQRRTKTAPPTGDDVAGPLEGSTA